MVVQGGESRTARKWTEAEEAYLRGLWADPERVETRAAIAAEVLGRTVGAVEAHASVIGATKPRVRVTLGEIRSWRALRAQGVSVRQIASSTGRAKATIQAHLGERP